MTSKTEFLLLFYYLSTDTSLVKFLWRSDQ